MEFTGFNEIVQKAKTLPVKMRGVVVGANDEHILEAVVHGARDGLVVPILLGKKVGIAKHLQELGACADDFEIIDMEGPEAMGQKAVELIKEGKGDFLIKGLVDTKDVLKPVVNKENNLHTGRAMSHMAFYEQPHYHKLVVYTDGGMIPYPDLAMKKDIVTNAVQTLRAMGYRKPRVGVLCGVEKVNPKMVETVDAQALTEMNQRGELPDCIVEGPVSYDIAMSKEIAAIKGYKSDNVGNFDILVVPNLVSGNLLGKCLVLAAEAKMAGIIVGAKIPIVLTSRGSSAEEKYNSIALCVLASSSGRQ